MATMPSSQEVQWDVEKAPPGGAFLVLNVGTNTIGLGSSCFFQNFPPVPVRSVSSPKVGPSATSIPTVDDYSGQSAVKHTLAAMAVDGDGRVDSADERLAFPKRTLVRGKRKGKDGVPNCWLLDTEERRQSDSSGRWAAAEKFEQLRRDVNSPEGACIGGDYCPSCLSKDPPGPMEVRQDVPWDSDNAANQIISSGDHEPPTYLFNLLQSFGWTVTIDGANAAAYNSPNGVVYHSLTEAFETFLQECSEREKKKSNAAQPLNDKGTETSDREEPSGVITEDIANGRLTKRSRKKKTQATTSMVAPAIPEVTNGRLLTTDADKARRKNDGRLDTSLEGKVPPCKEVNQLAATHRRALGNANQSRCLHVDQLPGPRRSARLSGKYVFCESKTSYTDLKDYGACTFMDSPQTEQQQPTSLDSDGAKKALIEDSNSWKEEGIPGLNQSCSHIVPQDNAPLEHRKTGYKSQIGEQISVIRGINSDRKCERNPVNMFDFQNADVEKDSNGEPNSSALRDAKELIHDTAVPADNAQNSTEVKMPVDLNMKDADEDDETGLEMGGIDICLTDTSTLAVNSLTPEKIKGLHASDVEVEITKRGTCVPDDVSAKKMIAKNIVHGIPKAPAEPESNTPEKTVTTRRGSKKRVTLEDHLTVQDSLTGTPLKPSSKRKSAYAGYSYKKRKKRRGKHALVMQENVNSDQPVEIHFRKKFTALSWLIDSGILSEGELLQHKKKNGRSENLTGLAARYGIICLCCNKTMSLSEFESHAGSTLCQPWYNICLKSGKTLMQCQMEVWEREKYLKKVGFHFVGVDGPDPSDDSCSICAEGGDLICCDGCPSTFHQDCLKLKDFPLGRWQCPYCVCTFCLTIDGGSDNLSHLTLFTCQQCYRKYHWECTRESRQHDHLAESLLFCGRDCREVDAALFRLLGAPNKIEEGFSWTLLKRLDEHEELRSDPNLLFMMDCNRKLSIALSIMNQCFLPVVDKKTGVDLISHAVYNCGSNFVRLNYAGFYNVILEKDEEITAVASLRFHGRDLAEMPFIGAQPMHERQGICHRLLNVLEELLASLHVKKLIVPAIPELLDMWVTSFAFRSLKQSDKDEIRNLSLVVLPRTSLLQKYIHPKRGENDLAGATADPVEASTGAPDLRSDVVDGKQSNSGNTVVGGDNPPPGWNPETEGTDKHAQPGPSRGEILGTCSLSGDTRGSPLRPASSGRNSRFS